MDCTGNLWSGSSFPGPPGLGELPVWYGFRDGQKAAVLEMRVPARDQSLCKTGGEELGRPEWKYGCSGRLGKDGDANLN